MRISARKRTDRRRRAGHSEKSGQRRARGGAGACDERRPVAAKESSRSHFLRLRDGTARSLETSTIHLDTIRDLKQINSLLASMAYPVLEEQGLLRGSRLKAD